MTPSSVMRPVAPENQETGGSKGRELDGSGGRYPDRSHFNSSINHRSERSVVVASECWHSCTVEFIELLLCWVRERSRHFFMSRRHASTGMSQPNSVNVLVKFITSFGSRTLWGP